MGKFTDSAPYKRLQGILNLPDDGTPEMAKAKKAAENRLGQLATSSMAKDMGVEDPFAKTKPTSTTPAKTGGGGSSGTLPNDKSGLDRPHLYKKGGKVAGRLATRGYGIAKK